MRGYINRDIEMTTTRLPIYLNVFYHDDVDEDTRRSVPRNYLKDCITELEKVLGRQFIIEYRHSIPGVTNVEYKGDVSAAVESWEGRITEYVKRNNLPQGKRYRYLLVMNDKINDQILGAVRAYSGNPLASLQAYQNIAHELGHSFGATHEDAELQYNAFGISCETYVYPFRDGARANCYRYSVKNRENMQRFFADED